MLHTYQHHSQSVQNSSESENETGSGSGSGSGSEEEQEQEQLQCVQLVPTQRRNAIELRQCGSAVVGASCSPQPALENYFAHLTEQYSHALALDGRTGPTSSYPKPKQQKEESSCTCTDQKLRYNTNRYIGYPQNNNYVHTYYAQGDRMVPLSSKPTTPKKGKEEHGYAYYGSNLVNNERVGHVRNNNNDSRCISQDDFTIPPSSRSKLKKGNIERGYAYEESGFGNNQHVVYGSKEYYDMMYNGAPKSSTSTSSRTSNKGITYM